MIALVGDGSKWLKLKAPLLATTLAKLALLQLRPHSSRDVAASSTSTSTRT